MYSFELDPLPSSSTGTAATGSTETGASAPCTREPVQVHVLVLVCIQYKH